MAFRIMEMMENRVYHITTTTTMTNFALQRGGTTRPRGEHADILGCNVQGFYKEINKDKKEVKRIEIA
jgi:hypothetical protein